MTALPLAEDRRQTECTMKTNWAAYVSIKHIFVLGSAAGTYLSKK